jgi:hypothetical protein
VAAIALAAAAPQQTYKQKFSSNKAAKSVGTVFSTDTADDPSNSANNNQPSAARSFTIKFPAGTSVDYKAAPVCKASDDDIITKGGKAACPKAVIGGGHATAKLPFAFPDVKATVTAFNAKNSLVLYVNPLPTAQPFVLRPKFRGKLKNGPSLVTVVPPNCVPPATVQGGSCKKSDGSAGQEAVLTHFDLTTKPKSKKIKKTRHTLIKTPKRCKGSWKFTATIKYANGTSNKINSSQKCKK